jgi:hypothetical protein
MMQLVGSNGANEEGWLELEGSPADLQEGDIVLDGMYAVLKKTPGNHSGEPATQLTLAYATDFIMDQRDSRTPTEQGRVVLVNNTLLRFQRMVEEIDWGMEPELHWYLESCPDAGTYEEEFPYEWRGMCKDAPTGMLVVVGDGAKAKIVDTAYPNGAVIFMDGTVLQSHPNKEWVGWLREEYRVHDGGQNRPLKELGKK